MTTTRHTHSRRSFLSMAAGAGLSLALPRAARAEEIALTPYEGKLLVTINATGGWDPTLLCDPKGNPVNQGFGTDEIETIGGFSVPPLAAVTAFFDKHKDRMMVINGIDTETNNHNPGVRNVWSGTLAEGRPSLGALFAAANAPELPLSFVAESEYDETAGQVVRSRAEAANLSEVQRIAFPNRIDGGGIDRYFDDAAYTRLQQARKSRLSSLRTPQRLPRLKRAMDNLFSARVGISELENLVDFLEAPQDTNNRIIEKAQFALAGYRAGLTASASISVFGNGDNNEGLFDTHSNNDARQEAALKVVLDGVDFLFDTAEAGGFADKLVVVVGSDFARTPTYNNNNGKDHWPYTSMMVLGAGVPAGKTVGATTASQGAMRVLPGTLTAVPDADPMGLRLTPGHVQVALRKMLGIDSSPALANFQLNAESLPIFA